MCFNEAFAVAKCCKSHIFKFQYNSKGTATFQCATHVDCNAHTRVLSLAGFKNMFKVEYYISCTHANTKVETINYKTLPVALKEVVDTGLQSNTGATKIFCNMLTKCHNLKMYKELATLDKQG